MTTEKYIPLHILEEITNGFSVDARIGRGGYGDVYKGVYNEREIAVKLLHVNIVQGLDDKLYINEVGNLLRVKHPNIVQLLGYSYEIKKKYVEHNGEKVFSKHIYRVLCFEYLKDGSLDKHLHAQSFAPNWCTRYNIIKGICEGLNFLHRCEPQIWHLDLKPANILLDSSMEPKLADFGLSRLFTQSHIHVTDNIVGTRKYMPPEFIQQGDMSSKNDVFSLGVVMIEIMTGRQTGYSNSSETGDITQLVQKVLSNWKIRIKATSEYPSEESHQVQTCINTAMRCVELDRNKRPTIAEVLDILNMTESHIPKKQLADELPCQTVGSKNAIANMLRTTTPEVDNIRNKHQHFNSMPRDSFNIDVQQVHAHRETSSDLEHTLIIGRTEEKQKILSILSESITEEMVILPIYGIGGIGKTTLAQLVFNDTQFRGYSRVWVYVSQEFNLNTIGNSIISQLTNNSSNISNKQMLHKRLQDIFVGNSILIVLDDLWEEKQQELDKLKAMLRFGWGSKVIVVTTRDEAIARKICGTVIPYKLENLTDDMCWTIIQQKSDFKTRHDKDQLEQIGRDIAMKCGGVALAAQSLGYMLRGMTSDQWQSVRDSNIWNLSTSEDPSLRTNEVLASLLLSYSQMPECLQSCFSYCAVFPKGRKIVKCDLIHQWIALGFPEPSRIFDSMQLCEKYVTQLLGMSFLQYSKAPSSHGRWGEDITLFTMHDLVHDLATEMLADKVNKGNVVGSSCHYAFLTNCSKPLQLRLSSPENTCFKIFFNPFQKRSTPENVKALFFLDCGEIELRGCAFSAAKFLLVLDLSECFIRKLPDSIGHLKKLRYLHAPRIGDRMIPSCITDLSELNYLNLGGSENISELPKSIGDMKGLMHLDLSGCTKICELPISFAELKQLVHLDLSHCNLSVAEALGGFTKLQYLNLSGCDGVYELPETFGDLKQLVHLDLSQCRMSMSEEFGGFTKLQYLNLSNKLYARADRGGVLEIIRNLTELRYLNLCRCMNRCRRMSQTKDSLLDSISTLSNLEHLDLSSNSELSSIPESFGNLRKLHTLDLSHCYFLKKLPNSMDQMVSLKILNVVRNFRLDETMLSRLKFASLPRFVVQASSDKFSSNISLLQHTNPDELTIYRLENVKSAAEARSVKLIEKQRIKELRLQWTVAAERFVDDMEVLEQLVPPSSINRLYISGYRSVSIPDWLMGIGHYLPNLRIIDLCDFPKCKNLRLCPLRNLAQLRLCRMESLEEWNTELMFPKLATLSIVQCAKLMTKPCLPRAMRLRISGSDNMISSWGESSSHSVASSSPITDLTVEDSKVPLHQWRLLHQLPALRNLTITNCSDLTTSPKIIKQLSSLESLSLLRLSECGRMTSLLQWLGELTSLMNLEITDCNGIRSLPDSIQRLTELKYLRIDGCFTLMKWCKSKENEMKLAHITNKFFR